MWIVDIASATIESYAPNTFTELEMQHSAKIIIFAQLIIFGLGFIAGPSAAAVDGNLLKGLSARALDCSKRQYLWIQETTETNHEHH